MLLTLEWMYNDTVLGSYREGSKLYMYSISMTLRNRVYHSLRLIALVIIPNKVDQTKTPKTMPEIITTLEEPHTRPCHITYRIRLQHHPRLPL